MIRTWQVIVGLATCFALTASCEAAQPGNSLQACRDIADATARLACFDKAAAAPAASSPTVSAPSAAAAVSAAPPVSSPPAPAAPAATLDPKQQFGLPERAVAAQEVAAGTRAPDASKIEAHLSQVAPAPDQRLVFTLDNGQVWRQLSVGGPELLARQGDSLVISRGLLGSYWMQLASGRGCKVTRLR